MTADDLRRLGRRQLFDVLRDGYPIDPAALAESAYRGVSLGLPTWVDRLAWKTFQKVFHRDDGAGVLRGWNVRVEQRGLEAPSVPMRRADGGPLTFGHFLVADRAAYGVPRPCGAGLLLDYGRGGNAPWDVTRLLRDPIVALRPGAADLLLGWSYLDLGIARVGTPSFFSLEREGPLAHRADPPARRVPHRHIPEHLPSLKAVSPVLL